MLPEKSEEEKGRIFMRNFVDCMELGFSQEQLLALLNLLYNTGNMLLNILAIEIPDKM